MDRRKEKKKKKKKGERGVFFPLSWTYPMENIEGIVVHGSPSLPHPIGMRRYRKGHDRAREEKPWCWTNIGHVSPQIHPLIRRLGHVWGHVGPREDILHRNHHQLRGAPSYDVRAS